MADLIKRVEQIISRRADLNPLLLTLARRLIGDRTLIADVHESFSSEDTAIYITGQTNENKERTYRAAAELAQNLPHVPVFIDNMPRMDDWHDGYEAEREALGRMFQNPIRPIQFPAGQYNTHTEALGLMEAATRERRTNLIIVSTPTHQIRAFGTHVSVLQNRHPSLEPTMNIFNFSCIDYPDAEWEQVVRQSGYYSTRKTRMQWLETELSKVAGKDRYDIMNDVGRILAYMDARDKRVATHLTAR